LGFPLSILFQREQPWLRGVCRGHHMPGRRLDQRLLVTGVFAGATVNINHRTTIIDPATGNAKKGLIPLYNVIRLDFPDDVRLGLAAQKNEETGPYGKQCQDNAQTAH
jgi:hypothetical protein